MAVSELELHQFPYSHYNEKVRWALDFKGLAHRRIDYLPGPHQLLIRRLSGQSQVPVLRLADGCVAGSARIIDTLERRHPEPALYPADAAERERALEIQRYFDDEVGPKVRRALFSELLSAPDYLCLVFSSKRSAPVRALYRAAFPVARILMTRAMTLTEPAAVADAFDATEKGLDFVAREVGPSGYLVGDRFSVADLAAAALLAVAVHPAHPDMRRPEPMPAVMQAWLSRWAAHPGAEWVLERYRRDRPLR